MKRLPLAFFGALAFLSRIPVPRAWTAGDLKGATAAFPLVGILFGLVAWGIYVGLRMVLPEGPARALVLVVWYLLSGGLHLDGFADTVDGWSGGGSREEALRIMRDPYMGATGVAAVVLLLLTKAAALGTLPVQVVGPALVIMGASGRWAPVYAAWRYPSAREGGLGEVAREGTRLGEVLVATLTAIVAATVAVGVTGLLGMSIDMVSAVLFASAISRWLGGHTGDTYGFLVEVSEVVILVVLAGAYARM